MQSAPSKPPKDDWVSTAGVVSSQDLCYVQATGIDPPSSIVSWSYDFDGSIWIQPFLFVSLSIGRSFWNWKTIRENHICMYLNRNVSNNIFPVISIVMYYMCLSEKIRYCIRFHPLVNHHYYPCKKIVEIGRIPHFQTRPYPLFIGQIAVSVITFLMVKKSHRRSRETPIFRLI